MKIALLHLSDLHLAENVSVGLDAKIRMITGAVVATEPDCCGYLVLLSGDIAFSGKREQYDAAQALFSQMRQNLASAKAGPAVHFALIPGNHDCDFERNSDVREMATTFMPSQMASLDTGGIIARESFAVQDEFFAFQSKLMATAIREPRDRFAWQEGFSFGPKKLAVKCINTAWLSQINENQGKLLVPHKPVSQLFSQDSRNYDLVVTMMHHPYNWLPAESGREMRCLVETGSDLVLMGHEHYPNAFTKELFSGESAQYYEGGVLQDSENRTNSSFNVIIIDFEAVQQRAYQFTWKSGMYIGDGYHEGWRPFRRNKALLARFENSETFKAELEDIGTGFTHGKKKELKLRDVFVYPDLQRTTVGQTTQAGAAQSGQLVHSKEVVKELSTARNAVILGGDLAGKSALARMLYADLKSRDLVPILLSGKLLAEHSGEHIGGTIKAAFTGQYSAGEWHSYEQLPTDRKAVLIDDFDECVLNRKARGRALEQLRLRFDSIILFADELFALEDLSSDGVELKMPTGTAVYFIREFGNFLRAKLIERWVVLGREHLLSAAEITKEVVPLEGVINRVRGRSLLPAYPLVVLTVLQSWEAAKSHDLAGGSYGHLYEMLIVRALSAIELSQTQIDVVMTFLSRLAHGMLVTQAQSFTASEIQRVQDEYHSEYKMRLPKGIIERLLDARVLSPNPNCGGIRFRYLYYYYFFVARYLRDSLGREEERATVRNMVADMAESIHYGDHANILSFFAYLTKDVNTIKTILASARLIYDEHSQADLDKDVEFTNRLYTSHSALVLPSGDHAKNRDEYLTELDKGENSIDQEETGDVEERERRRYDRSFSDLLKFNVASKMLQILGQVLRNSPGSLSGEIKQQIITEAYSLGLRTLKAILAIPIDNFDSLRTHFAELITDYRAIHKQKALTPSELATMADQGVIWLSERFVFGMIRRISQAIGMEDLEEIYADVLKGQPESIPFRLIDLSIRLDLLQTAPEEEVKTLDRELAKNYVAHNVLRELVFMYLYLAPVEYKQRQRLTQLMEIKVADARLVDSSHKKRR